MKIKYLLKNKKVLFAAICLAVCALIIGAACYIFIFYPKLSLTINGGNKAIEVFSEYTDEGAQGKYGGNITGFRDTEVKESDDIDVNTIGEYTVEYVTEYGNKKITAYRKVSVVDTTKPVIVCEEEKFTVFRGKEYIAHYKATDNYDGDITDKVVEERTDTMLRLSVSDLSGNEAVLEIPVITVDDTEAPVLSLEGDTELYIKVGGQYDEPGYTASDNADGDVTDRVTVENNVNCEIAGVYEVRYTVSDAAGNTATQTRTVTVYVPVAPPPSDGTPQGDHIVYLTFDDGPCHYTPELLDILKEYGVRATFFVTAQFPDYLPLIAREKNEGHAIGIHTYTHEFSIYASVDTYLHDFNSMQEVVKAQTGSYANIMRFPGGSSNTVSARFCEGIMTKLSELVQSMGYHYFDWNVGSNDTGTTDPDVIYHNVINGIEAQSSAVILMHDLKPATIAAMPRILEYCIARGYTFATLDAYSPTVHHGINN